MAPGAVLNVEKARRRSHGAGKKIYPRKYLERKAKTTNFTAEIQQTETGNNKKTYRDMKNPIQTHGTAKALKAGIALLLLLAPAMLACTRSGERHTQEDEQLELLKRRFDAGRRLEDMLIARNLEQALKYLDTLHAEFPRDPQFCFAEGWALLMQGDSAAALCPFAKAVQVYDSLIAAAPNSGDIFNRALIVGHMYGHDEYARALDMILTADSTAEDTAWVELLKKGSIPDMRQLFQPRPRPTHSRSRSDMGFPDIR